MAAMDWGTDLKSIAEDRSVCTPAGLNESILLFMEKQTRAIKTRFTSHMSFAEEVKDVLGDKLAERRYIYDEELRQTEIRIAELSLYIEVCKGIIHLWTSPKAKGEKHFPQLRLHLQKTAQLMVQQAEGWNVSLSESDRIVLKAFQEYYEFTKMHTEYSH